MKELKQRWEEIFRTSSDSLYNELKEGETLNLNFSAENTDFIRLNNAKVRQASTVEQGELAPSNSNNKGTSSYVSNL